MACVQCPVESPHHLNTRDVTRPDLNAPNPPKKTSPRSSSQQRHGDVHDAIHFLQGEHEKVLTGLHQEIQSLQRKCDDLQFEAHLSHVNYQGEEKLQEQLTDVTNKLEKQTLKAEVLEETLTQQTTETTEIKEQYRWKEVQLRQQIQVDDLKITELKSEISKLKSQIRDLRVYNSAVRNGNNRSNSSKSISSNHSNWSTGTSGSTLIHPESRSHRLSLESLDSGPRSIGSEDGELGTWREARLGSSSSLHIINKVPKSSRSLRHSSLPPSAFSKSIPSLPPLEIGSESRPQSCVTLPPISQNKTSARPHVRRQLRLSSAPLLNQSEDKLERRSNKDPL